MVAGGGAGCGGDREFAIGILRARPSECMSRLPLGFALAFVATLSGLLLASTSADDDRHHDAGGGV